MLDAAMQTSRTLQQVAAAVPTSDGAGVSLSRSLGTPSLPIVDPFLMLDEFRSDKPGDYLAGFPSHPHRGFETVTIMLAGEMQHKDSRGNTGNLTAGSVQWMTAGKGIIHSEMPKQRDGLMWGFQLWVNLPAKDKMTEPRYQDIPGAEIPKVDLPDGGSVRVLAGTFADTTGPIGGVATAPFVVDVTLPAGQSLDLDVPAGHNGFVYVYEGTGAFGPDAQKVGVKHIAVLGDEGDGIRAAAGEGELRFLLVTGRPINEPVARYGPFVMNTREELQQAFDDFRNGALG
jgi:redox-sensitive bicupin YhaK (pirin superfamily)